MTASTLVPAAVVQLARAATRVTVLTGAGMSAESGVQTFRDADTGLWGRFDPLDLATVAGWHRDTPLVNAWYLSRVVQMRAAAPNAGHVALARWSARPGIRLRIVTQNIDDLHERAGAQVLSHLHGSLFAYRCDTCAAPGQLPELPAQPCERIDPTPCGRCAVGRLRPGVVWFGEELPRRAFQDAVAVCREADLVLVVGTSGIVYPAASLPYIAKECGIPVVEIDPNTTEFSREADQVWRETAARALPAIVAALQE
ncbi:MAG: NAD-dependent deacylase [Dermatophilaceae bacterium]